MNNVNININLSYLDESTAEKENNFINKGSEIKKNLSYMFKDDNIDILNTVKDKKNKLFNRKIFSSEKKEEPFKDIDDKLNYIFESDIKKIKVSNSCKCSKTNCSKYYCNCLRNGFKCDFLCSCNNCANAPDMNIKFLNKKISR